MNAQRPLPAVVAHADWSCDAKKRWMARATLQEDGAYRAGAPEPVGDPTTLLARLRGTAGLFVGFDFPIGLPTAYAERAGVTDFLAALPRFGEGEWADFYRVAERPDEIGLRRPFYPQRGGQTTRTHLVHGLGVASFADLFRRCDRVQPGRNAACAIFWTLGGNQVGKAAIGGWRDVLAPALRSDAGVSVWPFSGALADLVAPGRTVIAETYPAEFYPHLGLDRAGRGWSKRKQEDRARQAAALRRWASETGIVVDPALGKALAGGFGPAAGGDDGFDAVVGLFGMLNVALGRRAPGCPDDEPVQRIEGWILGQAPGGDPEAPVSVEEPTPDYRQFADVGSYVFNVVGPRFRRQGYLDAFDLFCIVIWKANRAKTKIARKLLRQAACGDLDEAARTLTRGLACQPDARERLHYLWSAKTWDLPMPMASAILTALYPEEFTVYDWRVREALGGFAPLNYARDFETVWEYYQSYVQAVREQTPAGLSLRQKDLHLWGKSFHDHLCADVAKAFEAGRETDETETGEDQP